jgi:hypothetical protein
MKLGLLLSTETASVSPEDAAAALDLTPLLLRELNASAETWVQVHASRLKTVLAVGA